MEVLMNFPAISISKIFVKSSEEKFPKKCPSMGNFVFRALLKKKCFHFDLKTVWQEQILIIFNKISK